MQHFLKTDGLQGELSAFVIAVFFAASFIFDWYWLDAVKFDHISDTANQQTMAD